MKKLSKRIICLAKSRKTGGYCIAGKEILSDDSVGQWIRPVSSRKDEEISAYECRFENRNGPELLDIIEVPINNHTPNCFQCENYLINDEYYWCKTGEYEYHDLRRIRDNPPVLWPPHDSSYYGLRDRVMECFSSNLNDSLYLITPDSLSIQVKTEGKEFGNPRRRVRARFLYKSTEYMFPVTDPTIEQEFLQKENDIYSIDSPTRIYMCVSIGLPYENYCYKFVASIIGI